MTTAIFIGFGLFVLGIIGFAVADLMFNSDWALAFIIPGVLGIVIALVGAVQIDRKDAAKDNKESCTALGGTFYETNDMILETSGKARLLFYPGHFCVIEED